MIKIKKSGKILGAVLASLLLFNTSCDVFPQTSEKETNTEQNTENNENNENKGGITDTQSGDDSDKKESENKKSEEESDDKKSEEESDDKKSEEESDDSQDKDDKSLETSLSSIDFAKELIIGWNLGNTMDAPTETGWGMPETTKAMIDAVKAAGFKTIRIPVSWSTHVSSDGNYTIDSTWMARVKTIVDWAIADDMYVILNVHHDNYSTSEISTKAGFAISTDSTIQTKSKAYLKAVWTQIASTFNNDYNEKLIFEVLNEPRAVGTADEWYISNDSTAEKYCDVITDYENTCITAIRDTGGKNANRFIMVPGYAASGSDQTMLKAYTLPEDSAEDKLILSTHAYSPYNFAMANSDSEFGSDDEDFLTSIFNYLKTNYTDKGIGVVMGEASASNKDNTEERIKWVKDYFAKAKAAGIPVVLWDNMVYTADGNESTDSGYNGEHHGWLNRNACKWYFPTIIKAMMDTVGVTGYLIPEYVVPTVSNIGWDESKAVTISTTSSTLSWGTDCKIDKSYLSNAAEGSILKITFAATGAAIKIINSDWTTYSNGTIVNGSVTSDDGVITASDTSLYYTLTASDASAWKTHDIYIAGQNGTVTGIYFQASSN
ncbi:MAG: glycoside hydrolase family 5 protein [Treponema sp.]|nr:glycoside hydrolase family 5 protein [Treponema sp.]